MITFIAISAIAFLFLCLELPSIIVSGWPIDNRKAEIMVLNFIKDCRLNVLDEEILSNTAYSTFIAVNTRSILFPYYIDEVGLVWRWSKAAKRIKEKFIELAPVKKKMKIEEQLLMGR